MKIVPCCIVLLLASTGVQAATIQCHGNEPFWGAKVTGSSISFEREDEVLEAQRVHSKYAFGMQDTFLVKSTLSQGKDEIGDMVIIKSECTDGMSDDIYPYHIIFDHWTSERVYYGCCKE